MPIASRLDLERVAQLGAGGGERGHRIGLVGVVPGQRERGARWYGRDRHAPDGGKYCASMVSGNR